MATGARGRNVEMVESDRAAIVWALADEDALRVFAQVVAVTGTGLLERSGARSASATLPPTVCRIRRGFRSASCSARAGGRCAAPRAHPAGRRTHPRRSPQPSRARGRPRLIAAGLLEERDGALWPTQRAKATFAATPTPAASQRSDRPKASDPRATTLRKPHRQVADRRSHHCDQPLSETCPNRSQERVHPQRIPRCQKGCLPANPVWKGGSRNPSGGVGMIRR